MSNELVPLSEVERMAKYAVQSNLFGMKDEKQAVALMLLCQAEGLHPMRAVQQFHIIQGRPAQKAETMLARFQAAGGTVQWLVSTDTECRATFRHPQGGELTVQWTMERARKIGLTSKDNWKNYAPQMLRARCVTEGVRAVLPGCTLGIMSEEEAEDLPDEPQPQRITVAERGVAGLAKKVEVVTGATPAPPPEDADPERAAIQDEELPPIYDETPPPPKTDVVPDPSASITKARATVLNAALRSAGMVTVQQGLQYCTDQVGRAISALGQLTNAEADEILERLHL